MSIHIIVGACATGKTVYLRKLLDKYTGNVVTNLSDSLEVNKTDLSKLDKLNMNFPYDFKSVGGIVSASEVLQMSLSMTKFLSDITSMADYFIYDQPDEGIDHEYEGFIYSVVALLGDTFKECWITTHSYCSVMSNTHYYRIKDGDIVEITKEEAREILYKM